MPTIFIPKNKIENGMQILNFILISNLFNSKSELRRAMRDKGVRINDEVVDNQNQVIYANNFNKNSCKISFGKKKHVLIKIN